MGNFDKNPPIKTSDYDRSIRCFCGAYDEIFKLSLSCLKANLNNSADVLIVGAGSGQEIIEFGKKCPNWKFTGVDPSANMLQLAKQKIEQNIQQIQYSLFNGFVSEMECSNYFDAATCILVMHFLPDDGTKLDLLKSVCEKLKQGSPFVLVDGAGTPGTESFKTILKAWKQYPALHGIDDAVIEQAFNDVILKMIHFVPEQRIAELLKQAGFKSVSKFYNAFLYHGFLAFK